METERDLKEAFKAGRVDYLYPSYERRNCPYPAESELAREYQKGQDAAKAQVDAGTVRHIGHDYDSF